MSVRVGSNLISGIPLPTSEDITYGIENKDGNIKYNSVIKSNFGIENANKLLITDDTGEIILTDKPEQGQGPKGDSGADGKSAYEIALDNGFEGTELEWLNSLIGSQGLPGISGIDGKSAYEIWLEQGNVGDEEDFINSLQGNDGLQGDPGIDGTSITFNIGTVTTGAPGTPASVINVGTDTNVILDFVIPRGNPGDSGEEGGGITKLEIINGTIFVEKDSIEYVAKDISFQKYELKTVSAINITNSQPINIKIGEVADVEKIRYNSLVAGIIDDIIQYPLYDKDETGQVHIWFENKGITDVEIEYELRLYSLA